MPGHGDWVYSMSWSPNSCVLLSGGRDVSVRLWDVTTDESLQHSLELYANRHQVTDDFMPDSESTTVPTEAESDSDDDSPSSGLFGFGRKTFGAVTGRMAALKDRLDDVLDDTKEKLVNRLDAIAELSETAQEKFEAAKILAQNAAAAASNKIQTAAANAMDKLEDLVDDFKDSVGFTHDSATELESGDDGNSIRQHASVSGLKHEASKMLRGQMKRTRSMFGDHRCGLDKISALKWKGCVDRGGKKRKIDKKLELCSKNKLLTAHPRTDDSRTDSPILSPPLQKGAAEGGDVDTSKSASTASIKH